MNELQKYDNTMEVNEIQLDKAFQNFLERRDYESYNIEKVDIETNEDIDFVKVSHISYDRNKSETDLNLIDFQQLLSAIASKSQKFVYLIESSINGIDLYIGTVKEPDSNNFLKDTFEGIYSGSSVLSERDNHPKLSTEMHHSKAMLGIPALKRDSDKEYKQSLEKILFPMQGKKFRIVLVAESYDLNTIQEIISNYQTLGSEMHRFVKQSKNNQKSMAVSDGTTYTEGTSNSSAKTTGTSDSTANTEGSSRKSMGDVAKAGAAGAAVGAGVGSASVFPGMIIGGMIGGPVGAALGAVLSPVVTGLAGGVAGLAGGMIFGRTKNKSTTKTNTRTNSSTNTHSTNESESINKSTSKTDTIGITFDEINKSAEYCENLIDTYIERFQKGLNHGMWNSSLYIQAEDEIVLSELEHTLKSVYSGDETYYETIRFSDDLGKNKSIDIEKLPMLYFDKEIKHPIHPSFVGFSSAINTEELSILATLPNNDVEGLSVSKISSFGLTQGKEKSNEENIEIGTVLNKKKLTNQRFRLSTKALNSHMFVSGITGSGKSNTIKLILNGLQSDTLERKIPFLVIEPAKSEYKHLLANIENLQVFRPGAKGDIFKFNPFVFSHNKNNYSITLTKHVDMLKTTFSSAFPMYGPMPYILEDAIHQIYEDKGWSFNTEDNLSYTSSQDGDYDRRSLLFPNMEDLRDKIESVVEQAGYAGELDSNIKAALKTRINNLTLGTKGNIFNSRHAFSSEILFDKPTIVELSSIVDDEEKSFLMGLLLNQLYQHREEKGANSDLQHITVIEEAHRLLPNISMDKSNEEANSRAKAVETFVNILSEIRSYGEGIVVADQIASKLHRDVIKNTNIKILHRTMDKEDRELVGNSINLNQEQIMDIAELKEGEAIVHNRDIHQAFMVKVDEINIQNIKIDDLKKFYNRFFNKYEEYNYEIIGENRFYLPKEKLIDIQVVHADILKAGILSLINSVFFNESQVINKWISFADNIEKQEDKKIFFYLALKAFQELNYMSNIQFYKNVDCYLDVYKSFLRLIDSLISEDPKHITKAIELFKNSFYHENIKLIFSSMKKYSDFNIDYTLLILEMMTSNNERYDFVNLTMKENTSMNNRFDKILSKLFGTTSPELRHSLGAIRSGKGEIDFNNIVKEGF